jgi:predicted  nucleic acid-binding Zn-ribbon protein
MTQEPTKEQLEQDISKLQDIIQVLSEEVQQRNSDVINLKVQLVKAKREVQKDAEKIVKKGK